MTITEAKKKLMEIQSKISAYNHGLAVLTYDGVTVAPKGTAKNRAHTTEILSEELYKLTTAEETLEVLELLKKSESELDDKEKRMVFLMNKDLENMRKIPMDEYIAYQSLLVEADDVWHRAKEENDFPMFRPYLEKIYDTVKKFAHYCAPDKDPYDYWLNEFEEGASKKTCDEFFALTRKEIVPLIGDISKAEQVDDSCLYGDFPEYKQEELALYLMKTMGIDIEHCGLGTTEHPFTETLGSHFDVRITTNYQRDFVASSLYSVVHEGGHALYDLHSDDQFAYTVLDGGVSMGIHESQSRFYENLLGRSREFVNLIFPKLVELFPENFKDKTAEDVYRAVNKVEPSLIRTEADEVTYCLHVMIRYELEKKVMAGELQVKDLPEAWNKLYKEYLGVDVPNDSQGVLQDSHWAGGAIGYFPSYALGSAYGAHFLHKMEETVKVSEEINRGDFSKINAWNKEHIWKFGHLLTPNSILKNTLEEDFNPKYFIEYLNKKYRDIYGI